MNADLSYSTTNETVTPGNHLFANESSTTSLAPKIAHSNISTAPSNQSRHIQGTADMPNTQYFAHQTSYAPTQYHSVYPQFQSSFPPPNPSFIHNIQHPMTIPPQHPTPMPHSTYPHPHLTTQSTAPFNTAQLQVLDNRMQEMESRIINSITNIILPKLQQQVPTTQKVNTAISPTVPDLLDMSSMVTPPTINIKPTQHPSFAIPPSSSFANRQSSTTTSSQKPTSSPSITVEDLAKIMATPKEVQRPLTFPSFKSSADYNHWKQLCILKASKHPSATNMTI
jgi:hypothetical protein